MAPGLGVVGARVAVVVVVVVVVVVLVTAKVPDSEQSIRMCTSKVTNLPSALPALLCFK